MNKTLEYRDIDIGTSGYVAFMQEGKNFETIIKKIIGINNKNIYGLDSNLFYYDEINENIVKKYRNKYLKQIKTVRELREGKIITILATANEEGEEHYAAYLYDNSQETVEIFDSAIGAGDPSAFEKMFKKLGELLFNWIPKKNVYLVQNKYGCPKFPFQYKGGFVPETIDWDETYAVQNVYCHTWSLWFLHMRLSGFTSVQIICLRGLTPDRLYPLCIIKQYSRCILYHVFQKSFKKKLDFSIGTPTGSLMDSEDVSFNLKTIYDKLGYIWNKKNQKAFKLPSLASDDFMLCAIKSVPIFDTQNPCYYKYAFDNKCKMAFENTQQGRNFLEILGYTTKANNEQRRVQCKLPQNWKKLKKGELIALCQDLNIDMTGNERVIDLKNKINKLNTN